MTRSRTPPAGVRRTRKPNPVALRIRRPDRVAELVLAAAAAAVVVSAVVLLGADATAGQMLGGDPAVARTRVVDQVTTHQVPASERTTRSSLARHRVCWANPIEVGAPICATAEPPRVRRS